MTIHGDTPDAGPAARVRHNRWHDVEVPRLGGWTPTATVSVVVPAYQAHTELPLTLAALGRQTYPSHLLQVVVVDDGSDPPILLPKAVGDVEVALVRQEHTGFGAGRARNAGARAADGQILLFIDADIVADAGYVEAHARWHHRLADAATMGFRSFVDFTGIDADAVRRAVGGGGLLALLTDRDRQPHEWIERYLADTDDLRSPGPDFWRIVVGAGLGVRADLFAEMDGFATFGIRGIEDVAMGYRLFTYGAVLVPDRDAHSWHQGPRHLDDPAAKAAVFAERAPVMANHLPTNRFRPAADGRSWTVPALAVEVPLGAASEDEALACVHALLGGRHHDLVVGVTGHPDDPRCERMLRWFAGEPRVQVLAPDAWGGSLPDTPIRLRVPADVEVARNTVQLIHDSLAPHELGALHIAVPGKDPRTTTIEAVTTRALRRATRVAAGGEPLDEVVAELFGERWVAGEDLGLGGEDTEVADPAAARYRDWKAEDLVSRLVRTEQRLRQLREQESKGGGLLRR